MFHIAKYGLDNFLIGLVLGLVLISLPFIFSLHFVLKILFWIVGGFFVLFSFWFFRDPNRNVPLLAVEDGSIILAPADGKVVEIKEITDNRLLNQKVLQVSIFLSPLDVHVNRSPISGKVFYVEYFPGKYLVAYHPKASEENEHTLIGVENEFGKIAFKQIAGILARRVVCTLKVGDSVEAGEKIGMMKFGSRMDVLLPLNARIFVKVGQKVRAGETIIARLHKEYSFLNI
ncbi:MAG: Phosphatidylserine decarboxylase [Candidatus Kapaibacterium sp.]|nr:MAG: Phosphatidylserine decarboxylase [Candidatus Kapabacteria bacterium]